MFSDMDSVLSADSVRIAAASCLAAVFSDECGVSVAAQVLTGKNGKTLLALASSAPRIASTWWRCVHGAQPCVVL